MNKSILPAKGTTDISGRDLQIRQQIISTIQKSFERFGFEQLETPLVERKETLSGKYGTEAQNLIFWVPDHEVGLRYDHTVPLARFVANNQGALPIPYRRYSIGPVFRGENTQAGRDRQFTQCDFDTIGSQSITVDAEIVALNYTVLTALGFTTQFKININDRRLLNAMVVEMGFTDAAQTTIIMTAWDKLDKMSPDEVFNNYLVTQMEKHGVTRGQLESSYVPTTKMLFELHGKTPNEVLDALSSHFKSENAVSAIKGLEKLIEMIKAMAVPENAFSLNPLLARGLSYYTGPIFETIVTEGGIGSITGGGRYDELIETLGGPALPASGSSFGLERLLYIMQKLEIYPTATQTTQVLVTLFDSENTALVAQSVKVATELRNNDIAAEVYAGENAKIGKQISYADKKQIPLIVIIGPEELEEDAVQIKNLSTSTEEKVKSSELISAIKRLQSN